MAKRLTDTDKWKDDWFVSLSNDYRIIWLWLLDNCNHAGICKRSIGLLNRDCNTKITEDELVQVMGDRLVLAGSLWFIPKFLKFQYNGLNSNRPVILSVVKEIKKNNLERAIPESFGNDYLIIKDKDKDKDTSKDKVLLLDSTVQNASEKKLPQGSGVLSSHSLNDGSHPIILSANRPNGAPTVAEVISCFEFLKAPERMRKFFEHYESSGWLDGVGRSIIMSWQSKASKWVSDDIAKDQVAAAKAEEAEKKKQAKANPPPKSHSPSPDDILRQRHPERYQQ